MAIKTDSSSIWDEYKRGLEYQASMGFATKWNEFVNFVEGRHWPAPTDKTKYMPRPVINQCDFTVENKLHNILSPSLKMIYAPEEIPEDGSIEGLQQASQDMTDMAKNTWDDIDEDSLNEDWVNDTLVLGTGVKHYYFDNSLKGGVHTTYVGKLQCEIIDPMDCFLGNPHLKPNETQKQPKIFIRTKEDTDKLIEIAKHNKENWQNIQPDETGKGEEYDNAKKDMAEARKTTCITMYYKENGQVYWTKVTENTIIQKPRALAPDEAKPITLYPIEILVFKARRKCTFGRSMLEDIIPNQKALNFGLGMMLLSVQQTAWPKIIAKADALIQSITNEPGEILTDHSPILGYDGIHYMQPPNFSSMPMLLTDKLLEMTRQVTGVTEVSTGEAIGANMAASAIIALQNQAKKPNEGYQNKLFRSIKNQGRIYEQFYKSYYNMPRPIQSKDNQGNPITKIFNGSKYANMGFGLSIDVGPASILSESVQVTIIENMYKTKDLTKYQYVKYLPSNTVPQELKSDFEKEEAQMLQQQAQLQSQKQAIISQLTPEEQAELNQNPQMLDQLMQNMGGMGNESVPNMA